LHPLSLSHQRMRFKGIAKVELVFYGVGFNGKVMFLSEVAEAEVERMDE
ncbi:hypothetical protein Tco_0918409, partial [Tanacetum coccineum]